MLMVKM